MKTAIGIGGAASGGSGDFEPVAAWAVEAEKLGVSAAFSAEAWGQDAVAPLAFVAARTTTIRLGTGIMQISARTPSMTAMTALTLRALSKGRFVLGLGASGPQVVEGLQGQPFARPRTRMRETIEIVRMAARGEKLAYEGEIHRLPRPGGEGKALRLSLPPDPGLPIWIASLAPKMLELTGAVADGWLGTSFTPEHAEAHLAHLRRGAEAAGRRLENLELCVQAAVGFAEDPGALVEARKPYLAFTLGAMGSPETNFYNAAFRRGGFADAAEEVQRLWVAGRREEAARRVPDEMVLQTGLVGTEAMVRERLAAYRDAGIDTLLLGPIGDRTSERLDVLGRATELAAQV